MLADGIHKVCRKNDSHALWWFETITHGPFGIFLRPSIFQVTPQIIFREFKINYKGFENDIKKEEVSINFSDLNLIFNDLKNIFEKQGYTINWNELKKQSLDQTINTLAMASPFSLEEKQILLETKDINNRKAELENILNHFYIIGSSLISKTVCLFKPCPSEPKSKILFPLQLTSVKFLLLLASNP